MLKFEFANAKSLPIVISTSKSKTQSMATGCPIEFPMSISNELPEARLKDDDWTGKTDPAERRKRQNRLHQRAWRRRKALQLASATESPLSPAPAPAYGGVSLQQLVHDHVSGRQRMPITFEQPQSRLAFWEAALETLGEPESIFTYWAELRAKRKREIMSSLSSQHPSLPLRLRALQNRDSRPNQANCLQHTCAFEFPLSVDHQLFTLIQYNALRGVMTNMSILLNLSGRPLQGFADFYIEDLPAPPDSAPPSLQPTYLQKTVKHESWIDVLPYAAMRDNILRDQDNLDADALCDDFLGGMYEGLGEVQDRGIILWGEPWSEDGWEISEGFVRKWLFLLQGCGDLIKSTNRWREARGEERLVVEV